MGLSPAKLNLFLDVLGARDDGYHEIETLYAALDWGDDLEVRLDPELDGVELTVEGDGAVPADETNLAWRAAAAWREAVPDAPGVRISIHKRIPIGAGLGGGSGNAGSVLRQLQELHPRAAASMSELAAAIGSDVAFFLADGAAFGRGRGERIERLSAAQAIEVVLILPPIVCETPVVYRNLGARVRAAPESGLERAAFALQTGDPVMLREAHYNALAVPALAAYPALARFTAEVERRLGYPPCLSGSGSALYDLPRPGLTAKVVDALADLPGRRVVATLSP
ncbi:MAG: 4-(cytidine 5'-diphospho)-2-C-methyl-D-erythritol kinase [Planctomycetota bacterium]|nr:4-(cytidine 5'-diphospho)-2-C-methyl-D-erythritol kinase [Planctomycetota bacterium]